MKPRFSIRTLLVALVVISIATAAILNPNSYWQAIIASAVGFSLLIMLSVAIGAGQKLRLQSVSFVVISLTFILLYTNFESSPFVGPTQHAIVAFDGLIRTSEPPVTPDGMEIMRMDTGLVYSRNTSATGGGWIQLSPEKLESMGYEKYVHDKETGVSGPRFVSICNGLLAFLFGCCGFLITGIVYERRSDA